LFEAGDDDNGNNCKLVEKLVDPVMIGEDHPEDNTQLGLNDTKEIPSYSRMTKLLILTVWWKRY
jgi:hypothetical protein